VLRALREVCGWDARRAALLVGTSAGAQVAALLRAGGSAEDIHARMSCVRALPETEAADARWPGSAAYLRFSLLRPWRARPGRLVAALLPEGRRRHPGLLDGYESGGAWPSRPLWIPAVHFDSGRRVVFGRAGAPRADVDTAVRCSSAVPGFFGPVRLDGERYVDGGIHSPTHLDLIADPAAHPIVLVASPLSRFAPMRLLLRAELRRLRARGLRAFGCEPDARTSAAMGWNVLDPRVAPNVAEASRVAAARWLESEHAAPLRALLDRAPLASTPEAAA
jgi:NTE family protein